MKINRKNIKLKYNYMETGKYGNALPASALSSEMRLKLHVLDNSSRQVYGMWSAQRRAIGRLIADNSELRHDLRDLRAEEGGEPAIIPGQLSLPISIHEGPEGQLTLEAEAA